jgi:hypothetical protein
LLSCATAVLLSFLQKCCASTELYYPAQQLFYVIQ